jgi:fructuronate reductase
MGGGPEGLGGGSMSRSLGLSALREIPPEARPRVHPGTVPAGILHLGLGAFHRGHQAVYTEDAIAEAGGGWGIVGVAPRRAELIDVLAAQDRLFSVTSLSGDGTRIRVVGSLAGVRHAPSDPGAVVDLLADPAIRVVTLTVTEKAYRMDPAIGRLLADAEVVADLTTDRPPQTVPGLLVRGLLARARAGAGPIALVSCDNLPSNGKRLRGLVEQALPLAGVGELPDWVSFPSTMVDRIVPATTEETLARARAALGVADLAAVAAEPYRQWVIEDVFPAGRPAWERAGAVLTDDVEPWERLKLRALNGVHSALAYLGALAGCQTIAEALRLPGMRSVLERFIAEDIAPSFTPPPGVSVVEYGESVLERFANPVIEHRTLQVAMDGSQKLPQRVLHTLLDRRGTGAEPRWGALVVAAWMRFAGGRADDGRALPLDDPLAGAIRAELEGAGGKPAEVVRGLFALDSVFPAELAGDEVTRDLVEEWLTALDRHGVAGTLAKAAG